MGKAKNAIVLCSGGIDSVVAANLAKKKLGYKDLILLFFDYGQRALLAERKSAKSCAKELRAGFVEISLPELAKISTSLINKQPRIDTRANSSLKDTAKEGMRYYVPCRNMIFLSYAAALADSLFIKRGRRYDILTGFKCEGREHYPDTTESFVKKIDGILSTSCPAKPGMIAPLIRMDKEDIILLGKELGVDFNKTFSCYLGKDKHCGDCLSCRLRKAGFYWANLEDPTAYAR